MRYVLFAVMAFVVLAAPVLSRAASYSDNFDDGVMNPALWTSETDPNNLFPLYEAGGVLNFVSDGAYEHRWADYSSVWTFDLNNDFLLRTDFNFNYTGSGEGGVGLGINQIGTDFEAGIGSEKELDADGGRSIFWSGIENGEETPWYDKDDRAITSGWLGIRYNSSSDVIDFGAFDLDNNMVAGASYTGFRGFTGGGAWKAAVGGFADGFTVITAGQANLDNFQATVTPEPISCALFLFGGGALVLARKKKEI